MDKARKFEPPILKGGHVARDPRDDYKRRLEEGGLWRIRKDCRDALLAVLRYFVLKEK